MTQHLWSSGKPVRAQQMLFVALKMVYAEILPFSVTDESLSVTSRKNTHGTGAVVECNMTSNYRSFTGLSLYQANCDPLAEINCGQLLKQGVNSLSHTFAVSGLGKINGFWCVAISNFGIRSRGELWNPLLSSSAINRITLQHFFWSLFKAFRRAHPFPSIPLQHPPHTYSHLIRSQHFVLTTFLHLSFFLLSPPSHSAALLTPKICSFPTMFPISFILLHTLIHSLYTSWCNGFPSYTCSYIVPDPPINPHL